MYLPSPVPTFCPLELPQGCTETALHISSAIKPGFGVNFNHHPVNSLYHPLAKGLDNFWANVFANGTGSDRMLAI